MERARTSDQRGERGFALILAILALMLLTFLGLTLATTTTTELQIATNYRWSQQALYNADAGLEVAKLVLARNANTGTEWRDMLPQVRYDGGVVARWFPSESPAPVEMATRTGRDFERVTCDSQGGTGFGRVFVEPGTGTRFENITSFEGRTLNGGFSLWIRRQLDIREDGKLSDNTEDNNVIVTVEGVAPFTTDSAGAANATYARANQAVRVLEMPLMLAVDIAGSVCRDQGGQEGSGGQGDSFRQCPLLDASSLQGGFNAGGVAGGGGTITGTTAQ